MLRLPSFVGFVLFCVLSTELSAQAPGTGLYAFGSFDNRGLDSINIGNLNVHFEIPIVNKSGRGVPFNYVVYDGLIWSADGVSGSESWVPDPAWGFHGQVNVHPSQDAVMNVFSRLQTAKELPSTTQ